MLVLLAAAAAVPAQGRVAQATYHPFLLHVESNSFANNCGKSEWSSPIGECGGYSAISGHSYAFNHTYVSVRWCPKDCSLIDLNHAMPDGYGRWMKFCAAVGLGECKDWLLGAVHMPNGPFHVIDGMIGGKRIHKDDGNPHHLAAAGGPLHLVVTYIGTHDNGPGKHVSYRYNFGVIGQLLF